MYLCAGDGTAHQALPDLEIPLAALACAVLFVHHVLPTVAKPSSFAPALPLAKAPSSGFL